MIDVLLNKQVNLRELATKATSTLSDTPTSRSRNVNSMEGIIVKMSKDDGDRK